MVRHARRADRPEQDRVELLQLIERILGQVRLGLEVALRAPVEMLELEPEFLERGEAPQDIDARGNDLVADPVAGNGGDAVGLQAAILDWERPASAGPGGSSTSAPDQIAPIGLAMPLPAMSGAEPCTGSKIEGAVLSGLMLPEAAIPIVPAVAGPRSEMMSPNRFEATITSKRPGSSTIWMVSPST